MTNPRMPRPEPTEGSGYVNYLAPRSKVPEIDQLYLLLIDLGWRYDTVTAAWWTPVDQPTQFGRLEYHPEYRWAHIQPPSVPDIGPHGMPVRSEPILRFVRTGNNWETR